MYYKVKEIEELPQYNDVPINKKEVVKKITDAEGMELYPIGSIVQHQKFGVGVVTDISKGFISVDFESVNKKVLGLDVCVAQGYLKVIEKYIKHEKEETKVSQVLVAVDPIESIDSNEHYSQNIEQNRDEKIKKSWIRKLFSGLFSFVHKSKKQ